MTSPKNHWPLFRSSTTLPVKRPRRQAPVEPITDDAVVELYRTGATLDDLSNRFSRTHRTIRKILTDANVEIRPRGPRRDRMPGYLETGASKVGALSTQDIGDRYLAGASLDDLAFLCRCSSGKVRRILKESGYAIQKRGGGTRSGKADKD